MANRYLSLEATEVVNAFEECDFNEGADPITNTGETIEASESLPEESDLSDAVEEDSVTPNRRLYLKKRRIIQTDSEDGEESACIEKRKKTVKKNPVSQSYSSGLKEGKQQSQEKTYLILNELKKNNAILSSLLCRMRKTETRLKVVEGDLKKTIEEGNSSSSTPSRKRNVPDEVRVSCIL